MTAVTVLRLGHRFSRDRRLSTHVALVARAFGAKKLVLDILDVNMQKSISKICREWGGGLELEHVRDWKSYARNFPGDRIHLTMYGININECIDEIKKTGKDKLVIIGSQKVPPEAYEIADYNVAIGNQPHSEVAALAVFLDRLFEGRELEIDFKGRKKIIPQRQGKKMC